VASPRSAGRSRSWVSKATHHFVRIAAATFRQATHQKVKELGRNEAFDFFEVASLPTAGFEVIFAIVAAWSGRTIADALPFFSKVNLEWTASDLLNRGFKISLAHVDYASVRAA
jgi:uncharacterized protein (TIGR04141 family)